MLVDTPGMREFGMWQADEGLRETYADIEGLAEQCRFRDCGHQGEPGCAVADGVDSDRLSGYHKLNRELAFVDHKRDQQYRQQEKTRWKGVTKAMRVRRRYDPKLSSDS